MRAVRILLEFILVSFSLTLKKNLKNVVIDEYYKSSFKILSSPQKWKDFLIFNQDVSVLQEIIDHLLSNRLHSHYSQCYFVHRTLIGKAYLDIINSDEVF